jgi:acyl carrier protein
MSDKETRIKQIIAKQLGISEDKVTPQASLVSDLGADSLDKLELMMAFEDAFGIDIFDEEADKILTVEEAVNYLKTKI